MLDTKKNFSLLGNSRKVQHDIDHFLDLISDATDMFETLLKIYLREGKPTEEFENTLEELNQIETEADRLRRSIQSFLYEKTLIPDFRSDVLALLEASDNLINAQQALAFSFSVETPHIPENMHSGLLELHHMSARCIDHLLQGTRAFFRDIRVVRDHAHKVIFYESRADIESTRLKRLAFDTDLKLSEKVHLRYFVDRMDGVANLAEDIADSLTIYAIKRAM